MALLPARNILDGTLPPDTGIFRGGMGQLRDFLAGLLGITGLPADARASLRVPESAGFRNRIINAHGRVRQRATPNISAIFQYGPDRFLVAAVGGSSFSGVIGVLANSDMTAGLGIGAIGASWTSGQFFAQQRIEFANVYDMRGKSVTVSGKVFQDLGSSRNFYVRAVKANARDNFSATTDLATSPMFAVPSGVATPFSFTFTLGGTDADNGLSIVVFDAAASTISNKNMVVGDLQFELGSVATELEPIDLAAELERCQRYYEKGAIKGQAAGATAFTTSIVFKTQKRTTPTMNYTSTPQGAANRYPDGADWTGVSEVFVYAVDYYLNCSWAASAEL